MSNLSASEQSGSTSASVPATLSMTPPILAFIDCNIASGQDEIARESLMTHVGRYRSPGVAPLFVTWLRERSDLRFVCMVRNLSEFNDFMLDVVRSVQGVRATRTMLSFGGRADLDTLLELEMEVSTNGHMIAAGLWIDPEAGVETLELTYEVPVKPSAIAIVESFNPGAITLLEAYNAGSEEWVVIYEGEGGPIEETYRVFFPELTPVDFATNQIRVTLDTSTVPGWNEIDAVQLFGRP